MPFSPSRVWVATSILAFTAACSGLASQCTTDIDCGAGAYCNQTAQACFVRSTGGNVPIITSVASSSATQITVVGTAIAGSTVSVFLNSSCLAPTPAGSGAASSGGAFSVVATAPSSGIVYAYAESDTFGSQCSAGTSY